MSLFDQITGMISDYNKSLSPQQFTLYGLVFDNQLYWCTDIIEMVKFCKEKGQLGNAEIVKQVDFEVPQVKLIHIFK